ncbi:hypothetical protein Moror_7293 [Moniliophthora roreri MCA 2997]|uniref:Uncharacterized protein n=1 Tax=Moniliophthora roreri (strain MCA 2997) TaxID=1381753 RepID=V2XR00_MONRO|nr:hypothetical protein Moror_7293 [Moniliophthora roreri MCA 2997]
MTVTSLSHFKNITFDDRDTAHLQYNKYWFTTGTWNASNVGQSGTLSSANNFKANVTFDFPEPAKGFYYYGLRRSGGGLYGICVDCDPDDPDSPFEDVDALDPDDDGHNAPILLYSRTFDQPGQHFVVLKNQNDTRKGQSQITIDRFELEVVDDSVVTIITQNKPSSSAGPSDAVDKRPDNVRVIIGISVVGSRSTKAISEDSTLMHESDSATLTPFSLNSPSQKTRTKPTHALSSPQSAGADGIGPSSLVAVAPRTRRRRHERRAVDAGRVEEQEAEDDERTNGSTLPPEYDKVFGPC